jgi:hypothetical protein
MNSHVILYKKLLYLIAEHSGNMLQQWFYFTELRLEIDPNWTPYEGDDPDFGDEE